MLQQVVPIAQGNPPLAALAKEITLFAARGFRVARPLEEAFEAAFEAIGQMPPVPPKGGAGKPPPDPALEQAKVQADMQSVQADVQGVQTKAQTDRMAIAQKAQQANQQMQIAQAKLQSENERTQATIQMDAMQLQQRERFQQARTEQMNARALKGGME